jgi:hypothetical protein
MLISPDQSAIILLVKHPDGKPDYTQNSLLLKVKSISDEIPEIVWSMDTIIYYERPIGIYWDSIDTKGFVMISGAGEDCFFTRVNSTNGEVIWRY